MNLSGGKKVRLEEKQSKEVEQTGQEDMDKQTSENTVI